MGSVEPANRVLAESPTADLVIDSSNFDPRKATRLAGGVKRNSGQGVRGGFQLPGLKMILINKRIKKACGATGNFALSVPGKIPVSLER